MKYMKRVSAELETVGGGPEEEELIVQAVRFAFRVHQVKLPLNSGPFFNTFPVSKCQSRNWYLFSFHKIENRTTFFCFCFSFSFLFLLSFLFLFIIFIIIFENYLIFKNGSILKMVSS
mgnify:CR=1 FL=1